MLYGNSVEHSSTVGYFFIINEEPYFYRSNERVYIGQKFKDLMHLAYG